jgi:hypothetical protein
MPLPLFPVPFILTPVPCSLPVPYALRPLTPSPVLVPRPLWFIPRPLIPTPLQVLVPRPLPCTPRPLNPTPTPLPSPHACAICAAAPCGESLKHSSAPGSFLFIQLPASISGYRSPQAPMLGTAAPQSRHLPAFCRAGTMQAQQLKSYRNHRHRRSLRKRRSSTCNTAVPALRALRVATPPQRRRQALQGQLAQTCPRAPSSMPSVRSASLLHSLRWPHAYCFQPWVGIWPSAP